MAKSLTVEQTDFQYDEDDKLISFVEAETTWTLTYDGQDNLLSITSD